MQRPSRSRATTGETLPDLDLTKVAGVGCLDKLAALLELPMVDDLDRIKVALARTDDVLANVDVLYVDLNSIRRLTMERSEAITGRLGPKGCGGVSP
jgi:hypothetical protein